MRRIIASLDIGSSKIKLVIGEMGYDGINILCAVDEESRGVEKGVIVEIDETVYAIKKLLKKVEDRLNIKLTKVIVNVNEDSALYRIGEASISISEETPEIVASDIVRVLQMSVKGNIETGYDLVTVVPIMFKVDDRKTRVPKGLKGTSLSVKSVVISIPRRDIATVAKVAEKCGLEIVDIMLPSIGSYYAHKNESIDTTTGVIVDCGHETIKMAVLNKGIAINNIVLPIGGTDIDSDISYIYKITKEQGKDLKETLALANRRNASNKEKESVINTKGEKIIVNQKELSEIVMSRCHEMLNKAKNEINYLTKKEISYIIITGGLSELKDFSIEVESVFGRVASVGKLLIVGARDNKYASCIGMIKYFESKLNLRDKEFSVLSSDDEELLISNMNKKGISSESILGKVFGMFFDN